MAFSLPAYALQYDTVGIVNNNCDIGAGTVQQHLYNGEISVNFPKANRACKGTVKMSPNTGNRFTLKGLTGLSELKCSDGASIRAYPIADGIRKGHGQGVIIYPDKKEAPFYFAFANLGENAEKTLLKMLEHERSPCAPVLQAKIKN